jgi:Xaa-Pro aminopeptidase
MSARADRLEAELDGAGVGLLLVAEPHNVRYLTGYSGSNGLALVGPRTRVFVTDFRYVEQAAEEVGPSFERVRAPQDLVESIAGLLPGEGPVRLGFDDAHTSVSEHRRLGELLGDRVELVAAGGLVERLRRVKDADEVAKIAAATKIADEACELLLGNGLAGRTERELALALEFEMRERGADAASFDSIVAAGGHGALPHAQPRDVAVKRGDMVVIDWGALLDGYHSDCTRTVAVGAVADDAREAYGLVLAAQLAGLDAVRAGAHGQAVDAVARDLITAGGHGEHYGHGLGHGVGLDIHEAPRLSQRSSDTLASGNIVSVEPGVYLPGRFGIRIEDLVLVTDGGCDLLTGISKELRVVD